MLIIVASSDLWPTPDIASKVLSLMVSTEEVIGVRFNGDGRPSTMVEELAIKIGLRIQHPVIGHHTRRTGSNTGFVRDIAMVKSARSVHAFLGPPGKAETGTAHVIECALRSNLAVYAYGLADDGSIIEIGSDDGSHVYRNRPNTSGQLTGEIGWTK